MDYKSNILKTIGSVITIILLSVNSLSAQNGKKFTVLAGLKVEDCIPFEERFRFPEFTTGTVIFKNGSKIEEKLNYNLLVKEMEYLQGKDTLAIANENDIQQIIISGKVFIVNKGYLEIIYNGKLSVGMKQYYKLMDVRKKDPYGDIGSGAATDTYGSLHTESQYYKLSANQDRIFQKVSEYYLCIPAGNCVLFTKQKAKQLYPQKKKSIDVYLKSNKVNFNSGEDLIRFAGYLENL